MVFLMEEQMFSIVERKHNCVHGTFGVSIFLEEQLDLILRSGKAETGEKKKKTNKKTSGH